MNTHNYSMLTLLTALICAMLMQAAPCERCAVTPATGSPVTNSILNPTAVAYSRILPNGKICLAVTNFANNTVSTFCSDPNSCSVTPTGTPQSSGGLSPMSLAFSPTSNCLAIANFGDIMTDPGNVQMFSLNPDTCTITPIGAPLPTGGIAATLIDFAPNGTCISVGNEFSNTVSIFSINPTTCQATLVGTPVPAGPNPIGGAFSPDSTCLAVTNLDIFGGNPGTINTYSIDPATCVATPVSSGIPSGGFFPTSIDFSPISNCVAVANSNLLMGPGGNLQLFKFNPATCTLIQTGGPIATGGSNPITLSYSPDGLCLAVANIGSGTITLFNTTTTGCGLTPIGAPIATGNFPRSVAYSPDNRCLAVANSDFSPTGGGLIGPGSVSLFRTNFVTKPIIQALIERCSIVITGTADARTTIVVFQDGNAIGSTTTDALGNFSFTVKKHGTKIPIFTAQGVNAAGCISLISQPATLRSATSVALRTKYCSLTTSN